MTTVNDQDGNGNGGKAYLGPHSALVQAYRLALKDTKRRIGIPIIPIFYEFLSSRMIECKVPEKQIKDTNSQFKELLADGDNPSDSVPQEFEGIIEDESVKDHVSPVYYEPDDNGYDWSNKGSSVSGNDSPEMQMIISVAQPAIEDMLAKGMLKNTRRNVIFNGEPARVYVTFKVEAALFTWNLLGKIGETMLYNCTDEDIYRVNGRVVCKSYDLNFDLKVTANDSKFKGQTIPVTATAFFYMAKLPKIASAGPRKKHRFWLNEKLEGESKGRDIWKWDDTP